MSADNTPFFILGSVLSGTTLLRNLLRAHPRLICPEETHVFRWGEPFGSTDFNHVYAAADTLILHREMDGIQQQKFESLYLQSKDRKSFFNNYLQAFKQVKNSVKLRCFDKTPQNIYGMPLIKASFPKAKFIQIIRNPLNVVTSLKLGHSLQPQSIIGAVNFWKEAMMIIDVLKPLWGEDIYQLKYENLTNNPQQELDQILTFINEEKVDLGSEIVNVRAAQDSYLEVLTDEEITQVKAELSDYMHHYGYL